MYTRTLIPIEFDSILFCRNSISLWRFFSFWLLYAVRISLRGLWSMRIMGIKTDMCPCGINLARFDSLVMNEVNRHPLLIHSWLQYYGSHQRSWAELKIIFSVRPPLIKSCSLFTGNSLTKRNQTTETVISSINNFWWDSKTYIIRTVKLKNKSFIIGYILEFFKWTSESV